MYKNWIKFFKNDIYKTLLTPNLGNFNPWNAPYRVKHRQSITEYMSSSIKISKI